MNSPLFRITRYILFYTIFMAFAACAADGLVVHEWGTFTAYQDETGTAIGGINTDDEPVPKFVHNVAEMLLLSRTEMPPNLFQGAPSCHRDVTMRLETPVLYFHCAPDFHGKVDVQVQFKGGWLTQYYPDAQAEAPGIEGHRFGRLTKDTLGSLTWQQLSINADGAVPSTDERVWLAPRAVDAAQVRTEKGEVEKYLFYRGVAHLDAPLKVVRQGESLHISRAETGTQLAIPRLWYLDVQRDGTAAYRALTSAANDSSVLAQTAAAFQKSDYSMTSVPALRGELRQELMKDGLNADEADALLNTWELSYFKSSGARIFFLVPQTWTDSVMPLSISGANCAITRVMVGRIELVTPEQRALLKTIATTPSNGGWLVSRDALEQTRQAGQPHIWNDLAYGRKTLREAGLEAAPIWREYIDLGRFRNALVLDEEARHPTDDLRKFIANHGLDRY